jgi:SP family general alpha glucoside:H+ symporter-like MFS transporter
MITCLLLIGILACVEQAPGIKWAQSALCLVWLATVSASINPIGYTIVSEIGATQLRTKTVVLGRSTYYVGNIIGGVLEPYMMNPTQWNWKGKTAFFWSATSILTATWGFFRLPETKNRTFEELNVMFLRKTRTRQFAKEKMDGDEL